MFLLFGIPRSARSAPVSEGPSLRLIVPDGYLPGVPVLAAVEWRGADGRIDRGIWDAAAELSVTGPGARLSTNRVLLRNGKGSALVFVEGEGDVELRANLEIQRGPVFAEKARWPGAWGEDGLQPPMADEQRSQPVFSAKTLRAESANRRLRRLGDGVPAATVAGELPPGTNEWTGLVRVAGDVVVPQGGLLVIHPGALVLIEGIESGESGVDIEVRGALRSLGTEMRPVVFTAANPSRPWGEIRHLSAAPSAYEHTIITRGGNSPRGGHTRTGPVLRVVQSRVTFDNCAVTDHAGKVMQAAGAELAFRGCLFARSTMGPEIERSALSAERSWFLEMFGPDDNDCLYLHEQGPGQSLRLAECVFAFSDDDALDNLGSTVVIEDCIMRNAFDKGISFFGGAAEVRRCVISDCAVGLSIKANNGQSGTAAIDRTTIWAARRGVAVEDKFQQPEAILRLFITNSIIWAAAPEHSVYTDYSESHVQIGYSNLGRAWAGRGVQVRDPLFVQPGIDFRLAPGSPCIDAGDPLAGTDPDGTRWEIGAHSFRHATWPPRLIGPEKQGGGLLRFVVLGPPEAAYEFESSRDIVSWRAAGATRPGPSGSPWFVQQPASDPQTFFRLRATPSPATSE